jgi:hypothetical protein
MGFHGFGHKDPLGVSVSIIRIDLLPDKPIFQLDGSVFLNSLAHGWHGAFRRDEALVTTGASRMRSGVFAHV